MTTIAFPSADHYAVSALGAALAALNPNAKNKTNPHTAAADAINRDAELFGRGYSMDRRSLANLQALLGFVDVYGHPVPRTVTYESNHGVVSRVRPPCPPISLTLLPLARNAYGVK